MSPDILALLSPWLPQQRWYPLKDGAPAAPRLRQALDVPSARPGTAYRVLVIDLAAAAPAVADRSADTDDAGTPVTLQVPVGVHQGRQGDLPDASLIGTTEDGEWIYDALFDPGFMDAWLSVLTGATKVDAVATWHSDAISVEGFDAPLPSVRVMSSEQSNSSVVFELGGRPLIAKFFRVLQSGLHPEVELGRALLTAGNAFVPALCAAATAELVPPLVSKPGQGVGQTTLLVIHTFIPGGQDGWESALAAVSGGRGFTAEAHAIGSALARVHGSLRSSLGELSCTGEEVAAFVEAIIARLAWSWELAAAAVGPYDRQLNHIMAQLRHLRELPPVQHIHGDLHLGQLIHVPTPGNSRWYFLDFEGEPLRPLAERRKPDVALRDVVGMVRSFDYAGAQAVRQGLASAEFGSAWSDACSEAFIEGYQGGWPNSVEKTSVLYRALLLDKALYEVVYELHNRPEWVGVPVQAVRNLFESRESSVDMGLKKAARLAVDAGILASVSDGTHYAPHSVLGAHLGEDGSATIRTLRHLAESVTVVTGSGSFPMVHEHGGIWVAVVPVEETGHVPDYRLEVRYADGLHRVDDPYRYLPTVGELDLHLMAEGRHETLWTVLGAHVRRYHSAMGDVAGVSFAVWAPGVRAVRVIGEFNGWDGRSHAMRSLGTSGIWELFVPEVEPGARYKFEILTEHGQWLEKADPMAYGTEVPPLTASRVVESTYAFQDSAWMAARAARDPHNSPMSVYEVHLGSWRQGLGYRELATDLVDYVKWLGFTHVEFMPVSEHPFGGSWGYQVTSYFAPTSRFGHPDEFRFLVDALHQAGIGVIMDWVPAHFPKDEWALANFNGSAQYEHADPRLGEHPDWGTLIFDFGRNEVRNFLVANALYWMEEFHIDGLRVDAVASMLYLDYSREEGQWSPNRFGGRENLEAISFLQEMNATVYRRNAGAVTIAEESTAFPGVTAPTSAGGLGFGIKWNMGWMHDSLSYMEEDPVNRGWHHNQITFSLVYAFTENFLLPISHDEVVHGKGSLLRKMPGDRWQQLANLRAFLAFQWAHPGKQLIFMGTEFGQEAEWSEQHGLDWWLAENPPHRGIQLLVKKLNQVYSTTPALSEQDNKPEGFSWINGGDTTHNVVSFIRWDGAGNPLVCVVNFAGVAYEDFRVGVPSAGKWEEVLNTDSAEYGGSNVVNAAPLPGEDRPWDGQKYSVGLRIPPLGAVYLVRSKG
ncbi:1,4-alpha-glucan branching enzyme [Arthrobacter silviterrae]|uniref:1,4-alpha-glucan branching enzyme GlgB n=1 Tax=Arthrobacter silviterrae TaxID=2026658 RepID=A0ABX0DJ19_9MICC|nr:1,4-alpha-glucan branching protein GlgB [Arthrobacter silviterrae]MDQ0278746.1 1,4-alpha-glucan branching enzyme [Arthrobacter silviterrae]NGN85359.1 1,4-alpha-glucan branching protein GlgB [Arthrobacter silviterrae]